MSHVFIGQQARIVHNGDYSGNVTIENYQVQPDKVVSVPFDDMLQFVTEYFGNKLVQRAESLDGPALLRMLGVTND